MEFKLSNLYSGYFKLGTKGNKKTPKQFHLLGGLCGGRGILTPTG